MHTLNSTHILPSVCGEDGERARHDRGAEAGARRAAHARLRASRQLGRRAPPRLNPLHPDTLSTTLSFTFNTPLIDLPPRLPACQIRLSASLAASRPLRHEVRPSTRATRTHCPAGHHLCQLQVPG
eukprot:3008524-Rhodomonas_salina.2